MPRRLYLTLWTVVGGYLFLILLAAFVYHDRSTSAGSSMHPTKTAIRYSQSSIGFTTKCLLDLGKLQQLGFNLTVK